VGVKNCSGWDCIQQVLEYGVGSERGNEYHTTSSVYPCIEGMVRWGVQRGAQTLILQFAQLRKVCALRVDVFTFVRAAIRPGMRAAVQEDDSYMWGFSGAVHVEDSLSPEVCLKDVCCVVECPRRPVGPSGQKIKFVRPIVSNSELNYHGLKPHQGEWIRGKACCAH
jgi:hypothetical protein